MKRTFLLLTCIITTALAFAGTPAGTIISNQARAVLSGETYLSNEVEIFVRALCVPELSPNGSPEAPGQTVSGARGQLTYVPYTLTNAGNAAFDFKLGWATHVSAAWLPANVVFYHDLNANGQLETGEAAITELNLAAGARAALVVSIELPSGATGDTLFSPVASCAGGASDSDNFALISAREGPALQLFKRVSDALVDVGDTLSFTLTLLNKGNRPATGNILLSDDFTTAMLDGLVYTPDSVIASRGVVEYFDGDSWQTTEPATVLGVRLHTEGLAIGGEITLRFSMTVSENARAGIRTNTATASGDGRNTSITVQTEVVTEYSHYLGPAGNPRALTSGEGSNDDTQTLDRLVFGQETCSSHTLENAGNQQDSYVLSVAKLPAGVTAHFRTSQNEVLANPLRLNPDEMRDIQLCLTSTRLQAPFTLSLTAKSLATNATNLSYIRVNSSVSGNTLSLVKTASKQGGLAVSEELSYTLSISNDNAFDLTNVVVTDTLQPFLAQDGQVFEVETSFVAATKGGVYDLEARTVSWRIDKLEQGETLLLELRVKMPDQAPEGVYTLSNAFKLTANELLAPLVSNDVSHTYPALALLIDKRVAETEVEVGDVLHYTVTVANPNELEMALLLRDTLPGRTLYRAGSAVLRSGTSSKQIEPRLDGDSLVWDVLDDTELLLARRGAARANLTLQYQLIVQPGASGELVNTVKALCRYGVGNANTAGLSTCSAEVSARAQVVESVFTHPDSLLSGRVYLDMNNNNLYEYGVDVALPGARVVLTNGLQSLTDAEGRYTFRSLVSGPWTVALDSMSAPFTPQPHPESFNDSIKEEPVGGFQHHIYVQGHVVTDFPLKAPAGFIGATRRTTLLFGPLRVEKSLLLLPGVTRVVLELSSSERLTDLTLIDTVPGEAERRFTFEQFEGEQLISYDVPRVIPLTDPNARWRYP